MQLAEIGVILLVFGVGHRFSLRDLLSSEIDRPARRNRPGRARHFLGWGARWFLGDGRIVFGLACRRQPWCVARAGGRRLLDTGQAAS
jgi:predicted Kef-type K+ transport protein